MINYKLSLSIVSYKNNYKKLSSSINSILKNISKFIKNKKK